MLDLRSGRVLHRLDGFPIEVAFTHDGKHVVGRTNQKLRVWAVADGKEASDRPGCLGQDVALAVSPDGRWLASTAWSAENVSVWDLADGRLARTLPFRGQRTHSGGADVQFSRDGRTISVASYLGLVQHWDAASGNELGMAQLSSPLAPSDRQHLLQVRLGPGGRTVATLERMRMSSETIALVVRDVAADRATAARVLPTDQRDWAWADDGSVVAFPTSGGLVVVDGTDPSRTRFTVPGVVPNAPVVFSPDGRLLAARNGTEKESREVAVIEVATGRVAAAVKTGPTYHLALTDGGRTLVAAGYGSLQVFDTATGASRGRRPLPVEVNRLLVPDDRRAITALDDGTGLVWDLTAFATKPRPSSAALAGLWDALAGEDASAAQQAGWALTDRPAEAVTLFREKLKPARPADGATVKALIAKSGSPEPAEREAAAKTLQALGGVAAPALRSALKGEPLAERADRIKQLLAAVDPPVLPPGERFGTCGRWRFWSTPVPPGAEATGRTGRRRPGATLTTEAAAAVVRLKARSK